MDVKTYWRTPGGTAQIKNVGISLLDSTSLHPVATLHRDQRRVEWIEIAPPMLSERVARETSKYDLWATKQASLEAKVHTLETQSRKRPWWDYRLYKNNPLVLDTLVDVPELRTLKDWRILDIGGRTLDSWRFVWHGDALCVEHVEVSPASQVLAYHCLSKQFTADEELVNRFCFHTVAAEAMPFAQHTFDLVFSRSTIHHTLRPQVFDEINRVLRPGGLFWMLEPRLPVDQYALMTFVRWLRRADRGTDDPLRNYELKDLGTRMNIISLRGARLVHTYFAFATNQLLGNAQIGARLAAPLDRALSQMGLAQRRAHFISLVARKPE